MRLSAVLCLCNGRIRVEGRSDLCYNPKTMKFIERRNPALFLVLSAFFCAALLPIAASAHTAGASFETRQDGYVIDIGYEPEAPSAGDRIRFDFSAYPEDPSMRGDEIYTDVWVRIIDGEERILYAGDVHDPVFGQAGFTILITKGGEYTVSARFQRDSELVVETSFPLVVNDNSAFISEFHLPALISLGIGLLAGGLLMAGFNRKHKLIQHEQTAT